MRTIGKITGSFFAMIVVVSLFSMIVSAAPTVVTSGTVDNTYDYVLYSDGELKITYLEKHRSYTADLKSIGTDYLNTVKTITVDITNFANTSYMAVGLKGCNCPATQVTFVNNKSTRKMMSANFEELPKLKGENIFFPEGMKIEGIEFREMTFTNVDFLNNYPESYYIMFFRCNNLKKNLVVKTKKVDQLAFNSCSSLETVDLSASSVRISYLTASKNLSDVFYPDCSEEIYIAGTDKLKAVYLPSGVKSVYKTCFSECPALKEVYYPGTRAQLEKVKIYDINTVSEHVMGDPITSLMGNMKIRCFDGVRKGWVNNNNGTWSYLNNKSHLVKGWFQYNKSWYYFDQNGIMLTYWAEIDFNWYYLGSNGVMKTGWQLINGKWYYFDSTGFMYLGWTSVGGKWYYFDSTGAMKTGWFSDAGKWYYLKSDGSMASEEYCDGYWLNKDGSWTYKYRASWRKNSTGWWYGDDSGWYAKNGSYKIDGKVYTFDSRGYMK